MDAIREVASTFWREAFLRYLIIGGVCWYVLAGVVSPAITHMVTPHVTKVQTAETQALDAVVGVAVAECVEDRLKSQAQK